MRTNCRIVYDLRCCVFVDRVSVNGRGLDQECKMRVYRRLGGGSSTYDRHPACFFSGLGMRAA